MLEQVLVDLAVTFNFWSREEGDLEVYGTGIITTTLN